MLYNKSLKKDSSRLARVPSSLSIASLNSLLNEALCARYKIMTKLFLTLSVLISVGCMVLAAAPFTPAIGVSLFMLLLTAFLGYKGYLQTSLILLFVNTFAVIVSPGIDISNSKVLMFILFIHVCAFTGVSLGLRKVVFRKGT